MKYCKFREVVRSIMMPVIGLAALAIAACSCETRRNHILPPLDMSPREIVIVRFLAPEDIPTSATVKMRFLVKVLPSLGSLLSLDIDPDGDGPLPAEATELHFMESQDSYDADYSWWWFDYEMQVCEEQFSVKFFCRCERANRDIQMWTQGMSHGYTLWPY